MYITLQQTAFQEYLEAVHECSEHIVRINLQMLQVETELRWASTVKALQARRGVVIAADYDPDYTTRQEPAKILEDLDRI